MNTLTPKDRQQVHAILMTHAEMQDAHANDTLALIGRLKADEPDELDTIDELEAMVEICEEDCDNLRRIASQFGEV